MSAAYALALSQGNTPPQAGNAPTGPQAPWANARLRVATAKDSLFKKRGPEYQWVHEWVITEQTEEDGPQKQGKGWSCTFCGHARKQVLVERIREHVKDCEEVGTEGVHPFQMKRC
jgi:hypothetical protein